MVVVVVVVDVVHFAYEFGHVCVSASWYKAHTGSDAESPPCSMHGPVLAGPMYPRGLFFRLQTISVSMMVAHNHN